MHYQFILERYLPFLFLVTAILHASPSITNPTPSRHFTPSAHYGLQHEASINIRTPKPFSSTNKRASKRALRGAYTIGPPNAIWNVALAASYPFIPTMNAARDLEGLYQAAMNQVSSFMASGAETWNAFEFSDGAISLSFRVLNDDVSGIPWQMVYDLVQSFLEGAQMGFVGIFTGRVTRNGKTVEVLLEVAQNVLDSASEIHGG